MRKFSALLFFVGIVLMWASCRQADFDSGLRPEAGINLDSLVKRVAIPSEAMSTIYNANVILPQNYYLDSVVTFYPVVYLLHGYNGDFDDWLSRVPELVEMATDFELIIVMPEGKSNSWYLDSKTMPSNQFFTYISLEVPAYIDFHFRTKKGLKSRAITGLSMGGHGALSIATHYPQSFSAAGSMSGIVDLLPFATQWELQQQLGDPAVDSMVWKSHSVLEQIGSNRQVPALIFDCGNEDFALDVNRSLHQKLDTLNIPHTYIERPGGHTWAYWKEAIQHQLQYFHRHFNS